MQNFADFSAILTGKSRSHLVALPNPFSNGHYLQQEARDAFLAMQQAAKQAGFNLQATSSFRDFERQKQIWNGKFRGERKVHDDDGRAIELAALSEWEKIKAILRWSASPGASRHHWGTELDIFDPDRLPLGQTLKLEPWEYQTGGYFQQLTNWLLLHAEEFGFTLPFWEQPNKSLGCEPWHISYFPIAEQYERYFSAEILQTAWQNEDIAGKACLIEHLSEIFRDYIL